MTAVFGDHHRGYSGRADARSGAPVWMFAHTGQPRAAVGIVFALLVKAFITAASHPPIGRGHIG